MSVAKNLVDAGFIGVSISGPIVEASSSPMQVFIYALAYLFTDVNYANFSYWQTIITTFLIGFIFIRFFSERPVTAVFMTTVSAFGLTFFYPFFEWHASGMENAITHLLFLSTLYILFKSVKENHINYWLSVVLFFATIARLDSVYYIAILLIIYSIYWKSRYENLGAFYFSLLVFIMWLLFHSWRYYYFGDLSSNTAHAQRISIDSVGYRVELFIYGGINYLRSVLKLAGTIFVKEAGLFLFAFAIFAYLSRYTKEWIEVKIDKNYKFLLTLSVSLMVSSFFTPIVFGLARIDPTRTTTQTTLVIFLFVSVVLYSTKIYHYPNIISLRQNLKKRTLLLLSLGTIVASSVYYYKNNRAYYLGFSIDRFDKTRNKIMSIAKNNNINRPTISNPDIGIVTWHKELNIIDLGKLGTPIVAKLGNGPMMTEYYLKYGLPDIIEAHGGWIRNFCKSIFLKEDFIKLYSQVDSQYDMKNICSSNKNPPKIYWIRDDIMLESHSSERKLLNDLQDNLSVERIEDEISTCHSTDLDCYYIARTVYKFIPELRESNKFEKVYTLFNSKAEKALLRGWRDGQAHEVIIDTIRNSINSNQI